MNTIWKLMIFSIMLNFATGIMIQAIPAFDANPGSRMGLTYSETYADDFTAGPLNNTIAPGGVMEDKGNLIYRVLDMMNIGFIFNFLKTVDTYLFGFVFVLSNMFGGYIYAESPALYNMIFGGLRSIILVGYILGAFRLWTGKDLTE